MSEPTPQQVNSACLSYDHSFGLMDEDQKERLRNQAKKWLHAWKKELDLSEHPADDDELVTCDSGPWLESVGFHAEPGGIYVIAHQKFPLVRVAVGDTGRLWVQFGHSGVCVNDSPVRGDVRRLCAALGIELENPA